MQLKSDVRRVLVLNIVVLVGRLHNVLEDEEAHLKLQSVLLRALRHAPNVCPDDFVHPQQFWRGDQQGTVVSGVHLEGLRAPRAPHGGVQGRLQLVQLVHLSCWPDLIRGLLCHIEFVPQS